MMTRQFGGCVRSAGWLVVAMAVDSVAFAQSAATSPATSVAAATDVGATPSTLPNNVGLPRFPSLAPDGRSVCFSWRGDLWRVDTAGGAARRLTASPFDDSYSVWSPDGRQIAFTSERVGGGNVFVMNADGTDVRQVTQTDRFVTVNGWAGDELLITGRLDHDWFPAARSYAIPIGGGDPKRLFNAFGTTPAVSPSGSRLLITRGNASWSRRGYRGPDARDVWLYDRPKDAYTRLTHWSGNDGRAKWIDDRAFVYTSDQQDGTVNLYALAVGEDAARARRLTSAKGVDVEDFDVSRDGRTLVYSQWDRLYRLDLTRADATPEPIAIDAQQDLPIRTQYKTVDRSVSEAALSPDGKTMAVVAFGQVYVRGTDPKSPTRRVNAAFARCRDLAWSPDGSRLYFVSDETGTESIFAASVSLSRSDVKKAAQDLAAAPATRPAAATRPVPTVQPTTALSSTATAEVGEAAPDPAAPATAAASTMAATTAAATSQATTAEAKKEEERSRWPDALRFDVAPLIAGTDRNVKPSPSPDGTQLAFQRGNGQLWVRAVATGVERCLVDAWSDTLDWRWSPDGTLIAYVTEDRNNNRDVFIVPADGSGKPVNISRHPDNDYAPRWSADGKVLAFLSERVENESDVYSVFLDKDLESLQGPDLDQYYKEAAERAKKRERPKLSTTKPATASTTAPTTPITRADSEGPSTSTTAAAATTAAAIRPARSVLDELELDDAYLRTRRLTSLPGTESDLELAPAGDRVYFTAQATPLARATYVLERDAPEPRRLGNNVTAQALTFEADKLVAVEGDRAALLNLASGQIEYLDIADRLAIDVSTFAEQRLREAARVLGANYYDETMNGLDWRSVTDRYASLVRRTATAGEFDHVAAKLVGELNGSHLGVDMPNPPNPDAVTVGRLGIRTTRVEDGYRVMHVLVEGPSAKGAMKLQPDDVIVAVEGEPLTEQAQTLDGRLANRVGRETLVTVRRAIAGAPPREIHLLLTPITFEAEAALAYTEWRTETARRVEHLSGGRLGYIHVRGMDQGSLDVFERDLFAAAEGKEGLIIDVRNNGGGWTTDRLLASIMYPRHAYTRPRGFKGDATDAYPQDRLFIQRYTLPINMLCNEKSFSNAEIVSHAFKNLKRGTLVGQQTAGGVISTGGTTLLDGTTVRLPARGWFTPDGRNMEMNGAVPDLIVPQTPEAEAKEDDQQLKAAVEDLLKRIDTKR